MLLDQLEYIREQEKLTERKLEHLAKDDSSVQRLLTVPGIGRVTAEIIVAYLDDPKRFNNGRQVSSYAGMVPVQYQSGQSDRRGRITKRGSRLLRKAIVECGSGIVNVKPSTSLAWRPFRDHDSSAWSSASSAISRLSSRRAGSESLARARQ